MSLMKIKSVKHYNCGTQPYYVVECISEDGDEITLCRFSKDIEELIGKIVNTLICDNFYPLRGEHRHLKCLWNIVQGVPMDVFLFRKSTKV